MDTVFSAIVYLIVLTGVSVLFIKTTKTYWIDPELEDPKVTRKGEK